MATDSPPHPHAWVPLNGSVAAPGLARRSRGLRIVQGPEARAPREPGDAETGMIPPRPPDRRRRVDPTRPGPRHGEAVTDSRVAAARPVSTRRRPTSSPGRAERSHSYRRRPRAGMDPSGSARRSVYGVRRRSRGTWSHRTPS